MAGIPDAVARSVSELPDHLPGAERAGLYAQARPGQLLQMVPGVARYLARDGVTIEVAAEPGADEGAVDVFLNGSARAALIHQRGELPLHAATLVPPRGNGAVAICGPSGIGKSTLAAALSLRGWSLVADDMTRVTFDGAKALVWPGRGKIKLWRDACENFGRATAGLDRVREGMEKFFLRVGQVDDKVALSAIVELRPSADSGMTHVSGIHSMAVLSAQTVRPRQIRPLGRLAEHLRIVAHTAGVTSVLRLDGARQSTVASLADRIEDFLT